MHYSYFIPNWFFGFDIGMEVLFAIITLLVSLVAFKIYKVTSERRVRLFGIAFMIISASYVFWAGLNLWLVKLASEGFKEIDLGGIVFFDMVSIFVYMALFALGLTILAYVSCDFRKVETFYLMFGLSILALATSNYRLITFRILSIFLLIFIVYHYFLSYKEQKSKKTLITLIAFLLLLLSNVDFMFSSLFYQTYVLGHIFELTAYLLILFNLIKSVKK